MLDSYYDTLPDERPCIYFDGTKGLVYSSVTWNYAGAVAVEWEFFVGAADMQASVLFQFGASAADNRLLAHAPWSDGVIYADYGLNSSGKARVSAPLTDHLGRWAKIRFENDGNTVGGSRRLYINDVLVAQLAESQGTTGALNGLYISERSGGTTFWKGYLRNFKIWQGSTLKVDVLGYGTTPLIDRVTGTTPAQPQGGVLFVSK